MNKVITINLNGRAYQLEEDGFAALTAYLDDAKSRLESDPGQSEIIADLEQAIAEKCDKTLSPHKNVVASDDIKRFISEMGPVEGASPSSESSGHAKTENTSAPKRLYRIEEGAMVGGVANGFAAFFGIDVTLVRVAFVILLVITGGGFGFAYFLMMIFIPEADTMQAKAAAHGEPFNAQELVNRAKAEYARLAAQITESHMSHLADKHANKYEWHKWKHEMKMARKNWKYAGRSARAYRTNPILGIFRGALAVVWILALISLITTGAIFGWMIPAGVPIWLAVILLFVLYHAVVGPMRADHHPRGWDGQYYNYTYSEWDGIGDGLTILFLAIAFGWAYLHIPQVYSFVHHPILGVKDAIAAIKTWWNQ